MATIPKKTTLLLAFSLLSPITLAADNIIPAFQLNDIQPTQQFVTADSNTTPAPEPTVPAVAPPPTPLAPTTDQPLQAISRDPNTLELPIEPNLPVSVNASQPIAKPLGSNAQAEVTPNPLVGGIDATHFGQCKTWSGSLCQSAQDPAQFKTCLIQRMTQPVCKQFVAFATATSMIPRDDIDLIKHYPELDLIHLVRYGANYPGVYFTVGQNGELVDLIFGRQMQAIDIRKDVHYPEIAAQYPNVMLFSIVDKLPRVEQPGPDGNAIRLILRFQLLDGCHACGRAGHAYVAYDFSDTGALLSTSLESLEP